MRHGGAGTSLTHAGIGRSWARAIVFPAVLFAAAATCLVPAQWLAESRRLGQFATEAAAAEVTWTAAYAARFPGCVAPVLWPPEERPVAVVILDSKGAPVRIAETDARLRAATGQLDRTIAVCRRD